jgi:hypothetical protein
MPIKVIALNFYSHIFQLLGIFHQVVDNGFLLDTYMR